MYLAMDMGTSNTRIWLCDKKHIVDLKQAHFGAKAGTAEGSVKLVDN